MLNITTPLKATMVAACLLPCLAFAKDKKAVNYSVFGNFKDLPVNAGAGKKTNDLVAARFPGWKVSTDKLNGYVTDITGTGWVHKPSKLFWHINCADNT